MSEIFAGSMCRISLGIHMQPIFFVNFAEYIQSYKTNTWSELIDRNLADVVFVYHDSGDLAILLREGNDRPEALLRDIKILLSDGDTVAP